MKKKKKKKNRKKGIPVSRVEKNAVKNAVDIKTSALWRVLAPFIIVIAVIIVYANSIDKGFVLDDKPFIEKNLNIRSFDNVFAKNVEQEARPLVYFTLAANYAFGKFNTRGYHIFNIFIHILSALVLMGIVRRTLLLDSLKDKFGKNAHLFAVTITLFWALHPVQTESVTYIFQRSESMLGLFYFLSIYCLILGYSAKKRAKWYVMSVLSVGLAMTCKATIISIIPVMILYDRIFLSKSLKNTFKQRWVLYAATVLIILVIGIGTSDIHKMAASQLSERQNDSAAYLLGRADTAFQYYLSQPTVILKYLKLSFWPSDLCLDYKMETLEDTSLIILSSSVLLIILGLTVFLLLKSPKLGFTVAFVFIALAPTSLHWKLELMFEHRMYVSLAGLIAFTVFATHILLNKLIQIKKIPKSILSAFCIAFVSLTSVSLGARTIIRNRDYEDKETMYKKVIEVRPQNPRAQYNLANQLKSKFKKLRKTDKTQANIVLEQSITHYQEAIRLFPNYLPARINLSVMLSYQNRIDETIDELRQVIKMRPRHKVGLYNLALWLQKRAVKNERDGKIAEAKKGFTESLKYFRRSLNERKTHTKSMYYLGFSLEKLQKYDEARLILNKYLKFRPEDKRAHKLLKNISSYYQ